MSNPSSSSHRAVYIPPSKRRQQQKQQQHQQQRFHGAFTGGFSAGYFNTVDTKEGWKPSTEQRREQRLEDFMDDQDHDEWGGPTTVRQEYNANKVPPSESAIATTAGISSAAAVTVTAAAPLESLLKTVPRPLTVGPRLLRYLGWREGAGAAFVPTTETTEQQNDVDNDDNPSQVHLSKKRLRKIQLQASSSRIYPLPPPKLDHCGLGFEALDKAPEFQRYRQQRQELARLRARGQSNVYRVSNVVGGGGAGGEQGSAAAAAAAAASTDGGGGAGGGDYLSYETPEDFVGTRTVSGFAMRDDEDDAYDPSAEMLGGDRNNSSGGNPVSADARKRLLAEEYNTEIVELDEDSDVDDGDNRDFHHATTTTRTDAAPRSSTPTNKPAQQMNALLGGALASWATGGGNKDNSSTHVNAGKKNDSSSSAGVTTASGQPPLSGFRLGGSLDSHKKRYPGPDLPRDYHLKRHVFRPQERPAIFQTIGRALQLEGEEQARQQRYNERQEDRRQQESQQQQQQQQHLQSKHGLLPLPPRPLLGGNQFTTLAAAMKNRFTSETNATTTTTIGTPTATERVGLYQPPPVHAKEQSDDAKATTNNADKDIAVVVKAPAIVVRRATHAFAPLPLVCKRFGVPVPRQTVAASSAADRMTEATYFETEVLSSARNGAAKIAPIQDVKDDSSKARLGAGATTSFNSMKDEGQEEVPVVEADPRPSREKLKSIFEPDSDEHSSASSDDTDLDSLDGDDDKGTGDLKAKQESGMMTADASEMMVLYDNHKNDSSEQQTELVEYQGRELDKVGGSTREKSKDGADDNSSSGSEHDSSSRHRERKRKRSSSSHKSRKHKKKSSKKRKRSSTSRRSSSSSSSDDEKLSAASSGSDPEDDLGRKRKRESKEERRRKHSKKRKKKHSSGSRRKN